MENATNFSPPDSRVEVQGRRTDNAYVLTLTDHGIGMTDEQLREANLLLARPPLVSLTLARSLGFIVVGRLAARFGVTVRLVTGQSGGTTAVVTLPRELIVDPQPADEVEVTDEVTVEDEALWAPEPVEPLETPIAAAAAETAADEGPEVVIDEGDDIEVVEDDDVAAVVEDGEVVAEVAEVAEVTPPLFAVPSWFEHPAPATLQDAVPEGRAFDEGLRRLVQEPVEATPAALVEPPIELPAAELPAPEPPAAAEPPPPAPPAVVLPVREAPVVPPRPTTAAGLPQRARQAPDPTAASHPAMSATRRTPEEVRAMLSRYRGGLEEGRSKAGESDAESDHGARSSDD
jgi:hypothetical protein